MSEEECASQRAHATPLQMRSGCLYLPSNGNRAESSTASSTMPKPVLTLSNACLSRYDGPSSAQVHSRPQEVARPKAQIRLAVYTEELL